MVFFAEKCFVCCCNLNEHILITSTLIKIIQKEHQAASLSENAVKYFIITQLSVAFFPSPRANTIEKKHLLNSHTPIYLHSKHTFMQM